jgi:glyceraldehyde-3-phosphate dehydrogenase/erythrose-4-phosphate dehydrogenase
VVSVSVSFCTCSCLPVVCHRLIATAGLRNSLMAMKHRGCEDRMTDALEERLQRDRQVSERTLKVRTWTDRHNYVTGVGTHALGGHLDRNIPTELHYRCMEGQ